MTALEPEPPSMGVFRTAYPAELAADPDAVWAPLRDAFAQRAEQLTAAGWEMTEQPRETAQFDKATGQMLLRIGAACRRTQDPQ